MIGFPLHNSQLTRPDMVKVITAAIKVVLRRDMSLNRRLYAWLIGTDCNGVAINITAVTAALPAVTSAAKATDLERQDSTSTNFETDMDYFNTYSKDLLVQAVRSSLRETGDGEAVSGGLDGRIVNLRPFKVLMSLLDKPEVGSAILEDIILEIFRCMYRECIAKASSNGSDFRSSMSASSFKDRSSMHSLLNGTVPLWSRPDARFKNLEEKGVMSEIVKTANLLFGTFEPYFIWDFIGKTFEVTCSGSSGVNHGKAPASTGRDDVSIKELCVLVDFLLDKLTVVSQIDS